jgi:signal transduction histidine kinase/ligand-binding sensor domain-containing protein/DNA-binding NarL/FixJ family response regulator
MKHTQNRYISALCLAGVLFCLPVCPATSPSNDIITQLKFKQVSTLNGLSSDEVQQVFQDKEGFMWFATRYGLCKYDGYEVTAIKSNLYTPYLLTNNNITCLAEDAGHHLWIGTLSGLDVLDKQTGIIRKEPYPAIGNTSISCLLTTADNTVWVGSDVGLFRYIAEKDSMQLYAGQITGGVLGQVPVKSLIQDSDGDIWIGTWADGLYRYAPSTGIYYKYPQINPRNSAHVLYEDSHKNIWVGAWDEGLHLLHNPKDMQRVTWTSYRRQQENPSSILDNMVYAICEDKYTGTIWVGTRSGLSIMHEEKYGEFINYKSSHSPYYIPCNEINSIVRDNFGHLWLGTIGEGVFMTDTRKSGFSFYRFNLNEKDIPTNAVRALMADDEGMMWLGVGTYGVARHDRKADKLTFFSRIPEFSGLQSMPSVYSIIQRRETGEIWMGTYDGGLYVYRKGKQVQHHTPGNSDFLKDMCIIALYEDSRGNCWLGTRTGLSIKRADGTGYLFTGIITDGINLDQSNVREFCEDFNGDIWVATTNQGLIRIRGDVRMPENLQYANYNITNGRLPTQSGLCLFCDSRDRLWAGTEGHGLFLYDRDSDTFVEKSRTYNLPGDVVGSIEEDHRGNLWLGTNSGLVSLSIANEDKATLRVYTSVDGLQDDYFISGSSCNKNGELFFGGYKGYNSFFPDDLHGIQTQVPFSITDIKIFNHSYSTLNEELRHRISVKTPVFTQKIKLPYQYNNFSIEFASLTYKHPELNKYAYKLDGFDKDWLYADATRHFAYYNNLKDGIYTFLLKATNENGIWSDEVRKLSIIVLPPPWTTWWAYTSYGLLALLLSVVIYRTVHNRIGLQNRLRLQKLEQAKAEELNHSKLQFFTNITHELLTPLTIISATVDELKMQAPQYGDIYTVVSTNILRLIRLLQQILEFRKAETGNLKLRVSPGDIAAFIRSAAEAFQPLVKKQKLHFSIVCDPESIYGYFDTDKLDKILYNLLSNAAKYNKEGGFIQLNLAYAENNDYILISVCDNGKGISPENQRTLFKRFYEGDYRRFNTIGTGIGLSLVKDLVTLNSGEIWVESEVDKGTTFFIKLPIDSSYFKEDEIDEEVISVRNTISCTDAEPLSSPSSVPGAAGEGGASRTHSILILEDNGELLQLMSTLLHREYHVFAAENGREGIEIMENEDIHLVVSDIMMPVMDGIEFTRYVKGKLEFSHIPIILLTAKNKEEDRAEAYESGADGFISKPFNLTVLHARIRNLLKSKERMARDFKNQLVFEVKDMNYTSIDEDFLQRAIDCVTRHLDDPDFDQPQFVEEMATSKSTLYKKLKSLTGLNTSSFIRNIRLKAAVKIMEEKKGIRVSELAYAVGFNDPKYFSACFKKEFNILPSEYMERFIPGQDT